MTQQEQQDFTESLEAALSWMRAVQERLKMNDNTQGPRDALEARLRETEKIHHSQHEGRVKMDQVLVVAENLLQNGDEEMRNQTHAKLKDVKGQWEETCTYIIHCHSRIEWVWLHWSEYLKAYEEFQLWLRRRQLQLDAQAELQLGVREKLWQVDQQRVALSDVHGQAVLLERLLDEAAALHNRTQDPSVDPGAQERLQDEYNDVRGRAEERLVLLQKMAEEHQTYQGCVQKFQSWLLSKTKELTHLMDRESSAEDRLEALKVLDSSVASEEKTLQHIEGLAEAVRKNTSPAGAEVVVEEAEELRLGWQRLRQGLCEADEGLRSSLDSHVQYAARCQRLEENIGRLRVLLRDVDQELEEGEEAEDGTEEQIMGQWRKYTGVRNTLAGEESQVELLKSQLKELFKFPADSHHLSDDVLAVVKEHHNVKSRVTRLCSESQSELRNILQDPLLVFAQWSHMVSQVLEASSEVTDFSHIAMLVQSIERLLRDSVQLRERLNELHAKADLLDSVFGPPRSDGLHGDLGAAIKNRELLHSQLLQRKSRLQALITRTKDFGDTYKSTRSRLTQHGERLTAAEGLQPDILAKKSQSDQFKIVQKDLEDFEAHITALETLVSSSQSNRIQFELLCADWKQLCKTVRINVRDGERTVTDHEIFHDSLLNIEKWMMIMKQKLKSFQSSPGEWSVEGRQHEAQKALEEFPEKELQLEQMEAEGQRVLERTSEDGRVHIVSDMKRLRESWTALYDMSLNLHRLLNTSMERTESGFRSISGRSVGTALLTAVSPGQGVSEVWVDGSRVQRSQKQAHAGGELLEASAGSGQGGSPAGVTEEEGWITGHGGWIQAHAEGHGTVAGRDGKHVSVTYRDSGDVFDGADSSAWTVEGKISQDVSKGGSSDHEASAASHGLFLVGGKGGATLTTITDVGAETGKGGSGQSRSRRSEFETWLHKENELLSGILGNKAAKLGAKEFKIRQDKLKALRAEVPWGQEQFQLLLQESRRRAAGSGSAEDLGLEELRYRWMLYKSKLQEAGDVRARRSSAKRVQTKGDEASAAKIQKKPGLWQRVCRLALPLWLLLLFLLLLLLFLLPFVDESSTCSLTNNFARSFNIMLRYNGPPPT